MLEGLNIKCPRENGEPCRYSCTSLCYLGDESDSILHQWLGDEDEE